MPVAHKNYYDAYFFLKKHLGRLFLGLGLLLVSWFGLRGRQGQLRRWVYPATALGLMLLLAVLYSPWGIRVRGAQRWLGWGGFSWQPVEAVKICLLLYLSHLLARVHEQPRQENSHFMILGLGLSVTLFLLVRQPDLGNALIVFSITFVLLFLARVHLIYLVSVALIGLSVGVLWLARAPYVQRRLSAFIDPWQHAGGSGFQTVQSFIALGSGGLWGLGLGAGQEKLGPLPEAYTDFILAVIGAEWGMIGTGAIILLFLVFVWCGLKIASQSNDLFIAYLTAGITSLIGLQALLNIWVVTGLFPTKGLPLPFISYGGTSLVFNLMGVGVLLAVASRGRAQKNSVRAVRRSVVGR